MTNTIAAYCERDSHRLTYETTKTVNRINNVAYIMQYVIGINIVNVRWTHNDRWSAHNLINNIICNYLLLSSLRKINNNPYCPRMAFSVFIASLKN